MGLVNLSRCSTVLSLEELARAGEREPFPNLHSTSRNSGEFLKGDDGIANRVENT